LDIPVSRGVSYTSHNFAYPHGCCRKISGMQQTEAILSRWQFLKLCAAGIAGLSLLSAGGCGGSQGGNGSENNNGNRKRDKKDSGGGGGGGY
jgi:hypothetical protein